MKGGPFRITASLRAHLNDLSTTTQFEHWFQECASTSPMTAPELNIEVVLQLETANWLSNLVFDICGRHNRRRLFRGQEGELTWLRQI